MVDLFSQIKKILESRPDPPYEEGHWERMESKLDMAQPAHPTGRKSTILITLLVWSNLCLIGVIGTLLWRHNNSPVAQAVTTINPNSEEESKLGAPIPSLFPEIPVKLDKTESSVGREKVNKGMTVKSECLSNTSDDQAFFASQKDTFLSKKLKEVSDEVELTVDNRGNLGRDKSLSPSIALDSLPQIRILPENPIKKSMDRFQLSLFSRAHGFMVDSLDEGAWGGIPGAQGLLGLNLPTTAVGRGIRYVLGV